MLTFYKTTYFPSKSMAQQTPIRTRGTAQFLSQANAKTMLFSLLESVVGVEKEVQFLSRRTFLIPIFWHFTSYPLEKCFFFIWFNRIPEKYTLLKVIQYAIDHNSIVSRKKLSLP